MSSILPNFGTWEISWKINLYSAFTLPINPLFYSCYYQLRQLKVITRSLFIVLYCIVLYCIVFIHFCSCYYQLRQLKVITRSLFIVLYCIVFIHFYSGSHSLSLSEALPTTAIDTVSEFTRRS